MRAALRIAGLIGWTLLLTPAAAAGGIASIHSPRRGARAGAWVLHHWSRGLCRVLGIRIRAEGSPPRGSVLVVCNHLGYLDIPVLGALYPGAFLSMAEVAGWPLLGPLARMVGTLFIDRSRRSEVDPVRARMVEALRAGIPVTFFPEGRPSAGDQIHRFKSALFDAALEAQVPSLPVTLRLDSPESGEAPATLVCWWGDAPFLPHVTKLLRAPRIEAHVVFGDPIAPQGDRKQLAEQAQAAVSAAFRPVRQAAR